MPYIPHGTPHSLATHIDNAYNAGVLTGVGDPTQYEYVNLENTTAPVECQRRYHLGGISLRHTPVMQQMPAQPSPPQPMPEQDWRDRAPILNPPKPFDGTRSEFKDFIMQLILIFNSDPARYSGNGSEVARVAYAASYLSGSAKEWFQPHVDEITGTISFTTWETFVRALKAAFDDPDAYETAERKIKALQQESQDCSSYHAAFVPLAAIMNLNERTRIWFFRQGLHNELKTALSYQSTLPETFDAFAQACIKLDNQIRAFRETHENARTPGGQFTSQNSKPSTATRTHSGPMDLSAAGKFRNQKRGPVSDIEKKRRRDNNLCLYCGSSGHWVSNCPHKRTRGNTAAAANIATQEGGIIYCIPACTLKGTIGAAPAQILYEPKIY